MEDNKTNVTNDKLENNKKSKFGKSDYQKASSKEADLNKKIDRLTKQLEQRQNEIMKQIDRKLEEVDLKIEKQKQEMSRELDVRKEDTIKSMTSRFEDQIEVNVGKKVRDVERKVIGIKNGKIFRRDILIILLVVLVGFLAYCLYDVNYYNIKTFIDSKGEITAKSEEPAQNEVETNIDNNEEPKEEEPAAEPEPEPEPEPPKPASYYIENYSYLISNLMLTGDQELYMFQNDFSEPAIPNAMKLQIAFKNMDESKKVVENNTVSFKEEDLLEAYKKIFGENATIQNETFTYNKNRFLYYNNVYVGFIENQTETPANLVYKIDNATEVDGVLTFEITVAKKQGTKLQNILTNQNVTVRYAGEDIAKYTAKLTHFKITYNKVGETYTYNSISQ